MKKIFSFMASQFKFLTHQYAWQPIILLCLNIAHVDILLLNRLGLETSNLSLEKNNLRQLKVSHFPLLHALKQEFLTGVSMSFLWVSSLALLRIVVKPECLRLNFEQ